ncbi:N-acetylmuramoyl-L-alanine amidase [Streptomyces monticola]|uniref:N-acetylmuramoyl-L-alanine amidase n=1 Tax=Streptomyces monticola TaxID=2666263 RepID=A0ABW2JV40_9ACTN
MTRRRAAMLGAAGLTAVAGVAAGRGAAADEAGEVSGGGAGWMPGVRRRQLRRNFSSGGRVAQRGLILHVQEGEVSPFKWFSTAAAKSSSHFWVSEKGGIEQYVSVLDRAWTQAQGNDEWASVETSGFATQPLTSAQINAVARIYAWGARAYGWPLSVTDSAKGRGLGTHSIGGKRWGGHKCPGPLRARNREAILARARELIRQA